MGEWRNSSVRAGKRVAALAMLVMTTTAASTYAQSSDLPVFGMLGLARGQDAVLSLVLVGTPPPDHPGCRVNASFVDARGEVLRDAHGNPVQRTFELHDNVAAALTLRGAEVLGSQLRLSLRAVLSTPPEESASSDCTCMMATMEMVGTTGRSDLAIHAQRPPGGGNPPPPPACTF